jgi:hypothetical protein
VIVIGWCPRIRNYLSFKSPANPRAPTTGARDDRLLSSSL